MLPSRPRDLERSRGFSLLEVLLALAITLVVMALVAQTMSHAASIFRAQSRVATASASVALALDDIAREIALAGQGLGRGVPVVLPGGRSTLTLRSNPEIRTSDFEDGDLVLLVDPKGRAEPAVVARAEGETLAFRGLGENGALRHRYESNDGARVLGLREVRYLLEPDEAGGKHLVKEVVGVGRRVLSREVTELGFEYFEAGGEPIAHARVATSRELARVRVALDYDSGEAAGGTRTVATSVALNPSSGLVDFERHEVGFRLARYFYPIDRPAGLASRIGSERAVLLAAGVQPHQDPAYLYTFDLEKTFLGVDVEDVVWLDDVRAPVAIAFGPEGGPLSGSLFVAAWGLRIGHLARIVPDADGGLSSRSEVTTFEGTEAIAQAGGMAFGVDGALYVTGQEKGAVYRFRFDGQGRPGAPERLFPVSGSPGPIAEGTDGHLYFLMNHGDRGSLWRMAFDESLVPIEPVRIAKLAGTALSLGRDPVAGSLFALVYLPIGDFQLIELGREWIRGAEQDRAAPPPVVFSLDEWQTKLEEGRVGPRELPFPPQELPQRLAELRTDTLDFLAFDSFGSLYLGSRESNLVLKFELARPSGRYAVGVAAGVIDREGSETPIVRIHAWKNNRLGR